MSTKSPYERRGGSRIFEGTMKERKPLEQHSLSAIECLKRGVSWHTLRSIVSPDKGRRVLKDVARQVNWDEEDYGITILNVIDKDIILSQEQMIDSLQRMLDSKFEKDYTLLGYKRSGKRILDLIQWDKKIILGKDDSFEDIENLDKIILVDDDVSSGRTINYIRSRIKKPIEIIILFDYNRTQEELSDFIGQKVELLFPTKFFENVRDSELMFQDYYDKFHLFSAQNFDLTGKVLKFQYPEWKKKDTEIISIDLDGTCNNNLIENLTDLYPQAKFVINTGRDLEGAKYFLATELTNENASRIGYIIASNGATVYDLYSDNIIYEPTSKVSGLLDLFKKIGYNGGEICHYGDNENDICFLNNQFKVFAPDGSWLAKKEGVNIYDTGN